MKALMLLSEGFDDVQFFYPWYRLREDGSRVTVATLKGRPVAGKHGYRVTPDSPITELNPTAYDLLILPGGDSPAVLRINEVAVDIARTFMEEGIRVAAIDTGVQLLLSAGCLDGRIVTCARSIRDDVRAAGASYRDEAIVTDGNLLTARGSDDLPEFGKAILAPGAVRV